MCRQIPIGAAHISFLGHTQIVLGTDRPAQSCPWWPPDIAQFGPTLRQALARGGKIKMTLAMCDSQGKKARWRMVKPRLGLAGGVLFKANCQGVPIITQPREGRKIREHNTDMTETRAARVEQNTRNKAEPSTLYQVYRCIN